MEVMLRYRVNKQLTTFAIYCVLYLSARCDTFPTHSLKFTSEFFDYQLSIFFYFFQVIVENLFNFENILIKTFVLNINTIFERISRKHRVGQC